MSSDGEVMSSKIMRYCVNMEIPKYAVREEIREQIIKQLSDKHKVIEASKTLTINQSIIEKSVLDKISDEPKSAYEELSRVVCGIETKIKYGELEGKIITAFPPEKWRDNCSLVRTLLTEFIVCVMSGNKCINCANKLATTIKELKIKTQLPFKVYISCGKNNIIEICVTIEGGE